ncbi:MAG: hypothetical protein PF689_00415 [Deltaproteobacteria bacterium]|nr:hypothetical protein [Deltaproteobacteria bacterium]
MLNLLNLIGLRTVLVTLSLGIGISGAASGISAAFFGAPQVSDTKTQSKDSQELTEENLKTMNMQEILAKAKTLMNGWKTKMVTVNGFLATAKEKKNIMRINCIKPKIKSMKFWVSEGKSSYNEISSAQQLADDNKGTATMNKERMVLLFQKISVINSNIEDKLMAASRCIGDEKFSSGEGFELKKYQPDSEPYNPDVSGLKFDGVVFQPDRIIPVNPDWSIEMVWPEASPYQ